MRTVYAPSMRTGVGHAAGLRGREHRRLEQSETNRTTLQRDIAEAQREPAKTVIAEEQHELKVKVMSTGVVRYMGRDVAAEARMAWQRAGNLLEQRDFGEQPGRRYSGPRTGPADVERARQSRELEAYLQREDPRLVQNVMEQDRWIHRPIKCPIGRVFSPMRLLIPIVRHEVISVWNTWIWMHLVIRRWKMFFGVRSFT